MVRLVPVPHNTKAIPNWAIQRTRDSFIASCWLIVAITFKKPPIHRHAAQRFQALHSSNFQPQECPRLKLLSGSSSAKGISKQQLLLLVMCQGAAEHPPLCMAIHTSIFGGAAHFIVFLTIKWGCHPLLTNHKTGSRPTLSSGMFHFIVFWTIKWACSPLYCFPDNKLGLHPI